MSVSPSTGSIHANILFKGIAKEGAGDIKFIVKFHTVDDRLGVDESVILESVSSVSIECGTGGGQQRAVSVQIMPI